MKINNFSITFSFLFIFNLFANSSFSQEEEINKDDLIYGTLLDWAGKKINEPAPTIFKTEPFDEVEKFKTCTISEKEIHEAIAHLRSNYFLSIKRYLGYCEKQPMDQVKHFGIGSQILFILNKLKYLIAKT